MTKSRVLSNGLTFVAWLVTISLGLLVVYALRQMSFGLFALLGADVREAQLGSLWLLVVLAMGWIAFAIGSGEYHRKHVGTPRALKIFGWTLLVKLIILAMYLVL